MKTVYFVNVEIPAGPLMLQRKFFFETKGEREVFAVSAPAHGYTVTGYGIEHLLSTTEALAECKREAESV